MGWNGASALSQGRFLRILGVGVAPVSLSRPSQAAGAQLMACSGSVRSLLRSSPSNLIASYPWIMLRAIALLRQRSRLDASIFA